jgi:hypothetical protein
MHGTRRMQSEKVQTQQQDMSDYKYISHELVCQSKTACLARGRCITGAAAHPA